MPNPTESILVSDLREVTLLFGDRSVTKHIVHKDEVDRLVTATYKLHVDPAINVASKQPTKRVIQISVAQFEIVGPYWWSTPSLEGNDDPSGARLFVGGERKIVYSDPILEQD